MIMFSTVPNAGLFFVLRGTVYLPGDSVLMRYIGAFTAQTLEGAASSLICVTTNVNSQCCRGSDGGNVGEWFFPNGTMVPRNTAGGPFTRSGFTHQVRLNRYDALAPAGEFTCRVPDRFGMIHVAAVTIALGEYALYVELMLISYRFQFTPT